MRIDRDFVSVSGNGRAGRYVVVLRARFRSVPNAAVLSSKVALQLWTSLSAGVFQRSLGQLHTIWRCVLEIIFVLLILIVIVSRME